MDWIRYENMIELIQIKYYTEDKSEDNEDRASYINKDLGCSSAGKFMLYSINLSRVPRPYFNMGVGECVLTDTLTFPLIPNILFYCVQTVFTNR